MTTPYQPELNGSFGRDRHMAFWRKGGLPLVVLNPERGPKDEPPILSGPKVQCPWRLYHGIPASPKVAPNLTPWLKLINVSIEIPSTQTKHLGQNSDSRNSSSRIGRFSPLRQSSFKVKTELSPHGSLQRGIPKSKIHSWWQKQNQRKHRLLLFLQNPTRSMWVPE